MEEPLGEGGDRLHQGVYDLSTWRERHGLSGGESNRDAEVLDEAFRDVGAVVMGRRMFDVDEGPWGDDPPFHNPVFVVTHRPRAALTKEGGTSFTFVADHETALHQARAAAGDKDVSVAGGASIIQQYLAAGLLDELQIHLVPVILGRGRRLFDQPESPRLELKTTRVIDSPAVTHLKFRVSTQIAEP